MVLHNAPLFELIACAISTSSVCLAIHLLPRPAHPLYSNVRIYGCYVKNINVSLKKI